MTTHLRTAIPACTLLLATLLTACGGGSDSPDPSNVNASVTVTTANPVALNGIYATSNLSLSSVEKKNPIGGDPEVCTFRFSGLAQVGGDRLMDGDIRYIPGGGGLYVAIVSIAGAEFSSRTTDGALVDKTNNEVRFTGKVLTAGNGNVITLSGSIPMRPEPRPEGC
jgi:hypothetical protein